MSRQCTHQRKPCKEGPEIFNRDSFIVREPLKLPFIIRMIKEGREAAACYHCPTHPLAGIPNPVLDFRMGTAFGNDAQYWASMGARFPLWQTLRWKSALSQLKAGHQPQAEASVAMEFPRDRALMLQDSGHSHPTSISWRIPAWDAQRKTQQ